MQRIALLALTLMLSGCGYKTWWNPAFSAGYDPNMPNSESENMYRVQGQEPLIPLLTTEPGDIWPGPLAPPPTLQDLEAPGGTTPQPEAPVPGSSHNRISGTPHLSQSPTAGSSTPPMENSQLGSPGILPARRQTGQALKAPGGLAVTNEGGSEYKANTAPGGGQSIIVPNGNGTSTVIHLDGQIETIPAAK